MTHFRKSYILIVISILAIQTFVPHDVPAAGPDDAAALVTLQGDVAKLGFELDALKDRVTALERSPAITGGKPAKPAPAKPKPGDDPAAQARPYPSLNAMLDDIPKNLIPTVDNKSFPKLNNWMASNLKGKSFVFTQRIPEYIVVDKDGVSYAMVTLNPESAQFENMSVQAVYFPPKFAQGAEGSFAFPITDKAANKKKHTSVTLKLQGKIAEIRPGDVKELPGDTGAGNSWSMQIVFDKIDVLEATPPINKTDSGSN